MINFDIKYTLAFCVHEGHILMLHRKKPPNLNLWNGLGGKIEPEETPYENIRRELYEEAQIVVTPSRKSYKGIVKWNILDENRVGGTHLFIFQLDNELATLDSPEGKLEWKSNEWVSDTSNTEVVGNIPIFLPLALSAFDPKLYEFFYENGRQLSNHQTIALQPNILGKLGY